MPTSKKKSVSKIQQDNEPADAKLPAVPSTVQAVAKRYEETEFVDTSKPVWNYSLLSAEDVSNYQNGTHYQLYRKFGSHAIQVNDTWGMYFCVWAPNATSVSVKGNFNDWNNHEYELYLDIENIEHTRTKVKSP